MLGRIRFSQFSETAELALENAWIRKAKPEVQRSRQAAIETLRLRRVKREQEIRDAAMLVQEIEEVQEWGIADDRRAEEERIAKENAIMQKEIDDKRRLAIDGIAHFAFRCSSDYAPLPEGALMDSTTMYEMVSPSFHAWKWRHSRVLAEVFNSADFVVPDGEILISSRGSNDIQVMIGQVSAQLNDLFYTRMPAAQKQLEQDTLVKQLVDTINRSLVSVVQESTEIVLDDDVEMIDGAITIGRSINMHRLVDAQAFITFSNYNTQTHSWLTSFWAASQTV